MPVCRKCQVSFPSRITINNRVRVLSSRKFCLSCSPFGKHNTSPHTPHLPEGEKRCCDCKLVKSVTSFYPVLNSKRHYSCCRSCASLRTQTTQAKNKRLAVEYKGGKCEVCGYNKCIAALEFHHQDPLMKEFEIGQIRSRNIEGIKKELDKCQLLCCRCHREAHFD